MRQMIILFLMATMFYGPGVGAEIQIKGTAQFNAKSGAGAIPPYSGEYSGLQFGLGKILSEMNWNEEQSYGKIQIDHNATSFDKSIYSVVIGQKLETPFISHLQVGKMKSPIGMDYNLPFDRMDIIAAGADHQMGQGQVTGLLLKGDLGFGLAYDVSLFNAYTTTLPYAASSTSTSTPDSVSKGKDYGWALKIGHQLGDLGLQVAYGIIQISDKDGQFHETRSQHLNPKFLNFAARYKWDTLHLKAEYLATTNYLGTNALASTTYAHLGHDLMSGLQLVVRHYIYHWEQQEGGGVLKIRDLANTYLGFTYYLRAASRFQLNLILASGDTRSTETLNNGGTGKWEDSKINEVYTDDAVLAQWQLSFL